MQTHFHDAKPYPLLPVNGTFRFLIPHWFTARLSLLLVILVWLPKDAPSSSSMSLSVRTHPSLLPNVLTRILLCILDL